MLTVGGQTHYQKTCSVHASKGKRPETLVFIASGGAKIVRFKQVLKNDRKIVRLSASRYFPGSLSITHLHCHDGGAYHIMVSN